MVARGYIFAYVNICMKKMLYLVGMGICDEKDVSLRAVETLKKCDIVFAEGYTAPTNQYWQ